MVSASTSLPCPPVSASTVGPAPERTHRARPYQRRVDELPQGEGRAPDGLVDHVLARVAQRLEVVGGEGADEHRPRG